MDEVDLVGQGVDVEPGQRAGVLVPVLQSEREAAQRQLELRQQRQLAMSDTRRARVLDAARRVFAA